MGTLNLWVMHSLLHQLGHFLCSRILMPPSFLKIPCDIQQRRPIHGHQQMILSKLLKLQIQFCASTDELSLNQLFLEILVQVFHLGAIDHSPTHRNLQVRLAFPLTDALE